MAAKRRQSKSASSAPIIDGPIPEVGAREDCPCGSGKRYKNCHGRQARLDAAHAVAPSRPFAGLAGELDWVALREFVPAGSARVELAGTAAGEHVGREVTVVTLLPMNIPGLVRDSGEVVVATQSASSSGDPSRDLADTIVRALDTSPGSALSATPVSLNGIRLQDLLGDGPLDVVVHEGFDFWVGDDVENLSAADREALEQSNASLLPTVKVVGVEAAFWARDRDRSYVRQVLPHDEEPLLDALARLRTAGTDGLGEGTKLLGTFRALGHLVPLWELGTDIDAADIEAPLADFQNRLADAIASTSPLTGDERRTRAALVNRQLTLR